MKAATVKEIKVELEHLPQQKLLELCLRLSRFKKENKELLTYLLFEADNEHDYIEGVKKEIDSSFEEVNTKNLYIAKKNIRKILRMTNRFIKYSGLKPTEASILLHVCQKIRASSLPIEKSTALSKLYASQIKKIRAAVDGMHEDLQYDFQKELNKIE